MTQTWLSVLTVPSKLVLTPTPLPLLKHLAVSPCTMVGRLLTLPNTQRLQVFPLEVSVLRLMQKGPCLTPPLPPLLTLTSLGPMMIMLLLANLTNLRALPSTVTELE